MSLSVPNNKRKKGLTIREMTVFAMLGTLMFCSKIVMEALPNIHLLGMLTMAYTLVFRRKALIPIYIYVFLNGLYAGFQLWWLPYLYIWTILWGVTMLLPQKLPRGFMTPLCALVCALHGLAFGIFYAPVQALMYGFNFEQTLIWISTGLVFDVVHAVGNFCVGFLIYPVSNLLYRLMQQRQR